MKKENMLKENMVEELLVLIRAGHGKIAVTIEMLREEIERIIVTSELIERTDRQAKEEVREEVRKVLNVVSAALKKLIDDIERAKSSL